MWVESNPNPCGKYVGDCVIRALSILLNRDWDDIYIDLCMTGFQECDMPSSNSVWGKFLEKNNYVCNAVPLMPNAYTISSYSSSHRNGKYLLATGSHVVTVIDGNYHDAWDSGNEPVLYVWKER